MAIPVILPRQGQSVETCLLLSWKKNEGDTVARGDPLCEVETDKATFAVEAPEAGTLLKQYFREGQDVPVLSVIAAIGAAGERLDDTAPTSPAAAAASPAVSPPHPTTAAPRAAAPTAPQTGKRRIASPRATRKAAELRIPLQGIQGTGPGGRIVERDVVAAAATLPRIASGEMESLARGARHVTAAAGPATEIPVKGVRKIIAERMRASLATTAQLTLMAAADARALQTYRARLKASPEEWGLRGITITDLVLFALSRVLPRHPELNTHFLGDRIVRQPAVHLGLAVDTPRGLMVPVIRDTGSLTLREISAEAKRLATACLESKVQSHELAGATFTLTNLGALGVEYFTPVLNPPEVAILGVGSIQLKPIQDGDAVAFVPHLGLSLTIDHQAVDGAPGARFLGELTRTLAAVDTSLAL